MASHATINILNVSSIILSMVEMVLKHHEVSRRIDEGGFKIRSNRHINLQFG